MRDDEPRIGRPVDLLIAKQQQVEVDLARAPALARLAAEGHLDLLQGKEESRRAGFWVGAGRHLERGDGVEEVGLFDTADGCAPVKR